MTRSHVDSLALSFLSALKDMLLIKGLPLFSFMGIEMIRGHRFNYTYYEDKAGVVTQSLAQSSNGGSGGKSTIPTSPKIFESIRKLDHEGMEKIESQSHSAFCKYLSRTKNTICGRHPIGVLMAALEHVKAPATHRTRFVHYSQSSSAVSISDSSVSYASAFVQREA